MRVLNHGYCAPLRTATFSTEEKQRFDVFDQTDESRAIICRALDFARDHLGVRWPIESA